MPTVLIADDNSDLREILSEVLRLNGFDTLLACDGEHAWDLLQSNKADIVLSDIDMPHLDGISLFRRIRNEAETPDIPLVLITGKPPLTKPSFVFDVVQKPVQLEELLTILNLALEGADRRD